jgi:hypothetical protein
MKGQSGFLQISGLEVRVNDGKLQLIQGSEPLDEKQNYTVVTTDRLFVSQGGYWPLRKLSSKKKTDLNFRDSLEQALLNRKTLAPTDLQQRWKMP